MTIKPKAPLIRPPNNAAGQVRPRRRPPRMALKLIYLMFSKLLGWMVLRTQSDTCKEIEILVLRHQLAVLNDARHGRG